MPDITLDLSDAAELAETLTLLTEWLSGSHKHALADSFAAFIGHPAYNTGTLFTDLHRCLPPRRQRRRRPLRRAGTMTGTTELTQLTLDKITRITPIPRGPQSRRMSRASRRRMRSSGSCSGGVSHLAGE